MQAKHKVVAINVLKDFPLLPIALRLPRWNINTERCFPQVTKRLINILYKFRLPNVNKSFFVHEAKKFLFFRIHIFMIDMRKKCFECLFFEQSKSCASVFDLTS